MAGIVSYGAYVPRYRMARATIASAVGWLGQAASLPGEKAVANHDEDSVTMAVAAGQACIGSADRGLIDGLFFASTTAPYRERESATTISTVLDLQESIRTADFANSLKSGVNALLHACESVASGGTRQILVCSADSRLGKPGSNAEMVLGDAGAALLVGNEGVIASLEGVHSVAYDFPDHWRAQFDRYDRALEDRLVRDEGYSKFISQAVLGVLQRNGLKPTDISKVAYPCLYMREYASIAKAMGFEQSQLQESLLQSIGDAGTASPFLSLISALETAKPGDNIIVAGYGNGSVALWFKVTPAIDEARNGGVSRAIGRKKQLESYQKYAAFRGLLPIEVGMRGEVGGTALPVVWRDRKFIMGLVGSKCQRCGVPQLPPQRVCVNPACGAIDEMGPHRFSDKRGVLFSYTEDNLAFSMNPPQIYGMVDFEGGGRYVFDITDCDAGSLQVGVPMAVTFRRKYADETRGVYGYFWKALPAGS